MLSQRSLKVLNWLRLPAQILLMSGGFILPSLAAQNTPPVHTVAFAPGRVEIIGNHTDYTGGKVIAMPLEDGGKKIGITVELVPNTDPNDKNVLISSIVKKEDGTVDVLEERYLLGHEAKRGSWIDYFQGVTKTLRDAGYDASRGYKLTVHSDIPGGGGLSSSAALEVAQFRALRQAFGWKDLDDVKIARLGQKVENGFVGSKTGMMDQLTISLSDESRSMLLMDFADAENPKFERIPFPKGVEFVVFSSGVKHDLSDDHGDDNFNARRRQTDEALKLINEKREKARLPKFIALGEMTLADLKKAPYQSLPELLKKRVRHVVTENARVLDFREAIRKADWKKAGQILTASHRSSRDDYAVCAPEVDAAVKYGLKLDHVYGARMVGGGFGGPMLELVEQGMAPKIAFQTQDGYNRAMLKMHPDPAHRPIGKIQVGLAGLAMTNQCLYDELKQRMLTR
ncbi:MAG: galactokinase [Bdellovibrionia bacterium]